MAPLATLSLQQPQYLHQRGFGLAASALLKTDRKADPEAKPRSSPRTLKEVFDEALRAETAIPHVAEPLKPTVLLGPDDPYEILKQVRKEARQIRVPVTVRGVTQMRKLRKDALLMVVGVISFPDSFREDPERLVRAIAASLLYLKERFGQHLVLVVEHRDEANPHLHFFVKPPPHPTRGVDIDAIHPGIAARRIALDAWNAVGRNKELFTEAMSASKAYRDAMQGVQADYQEKVGQHFDLAQVTIGRKRGSRYWALKTKVDLELLLTRAVDLSKRAGLELQLGEQQLKAHKDGTWKPTPQALRNKAFMDAQQSVRDYYAELASLEAAADNALEAYLANMAPAPAPQHKSISGPKNQPDRPALQMPQPAQPKALNRLRSKAKALRQKALDFGKKDVDLAEIVRQGTDKVRTLVTQKRKVESKTPAGQLRPDPKPMPPRATPAPETPKAAPPPPAVAPVSTPSHLSIERTKVFLPKWSQEPPVPEPAQEQEWRAENEPQPIEEPVPAPEPEQQPEGSYGLQDSPPGSRFDPI